MSPGMKFLFIIIIIIITRLYRKYLHIRKSVCYTCSKAVVESSKSSFNSRDLWKNLTEVSGTANIGVYTNVDY